MIVVNGQAKMCTGTDYDSAKNVFIGCHRLAVNECYGRFYCEKHTVKRICTNTKEEYVQGHQQAEEDLNWMDDDFCDEDDDQTPDYWECHSCGKTFANRPMGGQCSCMSYVEEGYF